MNGAVVIALLAGVAVVLLRHWLVVEIAIWGRARSVGAQGHRGRVLLGGVLSPRAQSKWASMSYLRSAGRFAPAAGGELRGNPDALAGWRRDEYQDDDE